MEFNNKTLTDSMRAQLKKLDEDRSRLVKAIEILDGDRPRRGRPPKSRTTRERVAAV